MNNIQAIKHETDPAVIQAGIDALKAELEKIAASKGLSHYFLLQGDAARRCLDKLSSARAFLRGEEYSDSFWRQRARDHLSSARYEFRNI